jgi:hypothetical protein
MLYSSQAVTESSVDGQHMEVHLEAKVVDSRCIAHLPWSE